MMHDHPIILFDGVCNFCNSAVNFVIRRDVKTVFKFASLQSEPARKLLSAYKYPAGDLNSFVLIEEDKFYIRSSAVLRVCKRLNGLWPLAYAFIIVPPIIRDGIYNWVARNRYQWFGKREHCIVPTAGMEARFINE